MTTRAQLKVNTYDWNYFKKHEHVIVEECFAWGTLQHCCASIRRPSLKYSPKKLNRIGGKVSMILHDVYFRMINASFPISKIKLQLLISSKHARGFLTARTLKPLSLALISYCRILKKNWWQFTMSLSSVVRSVFIIADLTRALYPGLNFQYYSHSPVCSFHGLIHHPDQILYFE